MGSPHRLLSIAALLLALPLSSSARAELPTGYLVWSKGALKDPGSRKIYRLTLPAKTEEKALTSGEDIEPQVSPDGQWVAYAKAKLQGGSDYHSFNLWKIYVVSIHGAEQGRQEIKIDDNGYWPSWGEKNTLYYNQVDGGHSKIMSVTLDAQGGVTSRKVFFSTKEALSGIDEVNECFVSPDGSWFAARTRGSSSVSGAGAFPVPSPTFNLLARAGAVGCMPYVAPSGTWAAIAGAEHGIRWGDGPQVAGRKQDQLLLPARPDGGKAYHPGFSTDEGWLLAGHGTDQDHNSGAYDLYIYRLDKTARTVADEQLLVGGGFNGWPHVWVGTPSPPPPPRPAIAEFFPSSYTLTRGESTTLSWIVRQSTRVELEGQPVEPAGSTTVQPLATTRYRLVAQNSFSGEGAEATLEVTVNETPQPVVIEAFTAAPEVIEQGQTVVLSWRVRNPTTLDVDGQRAAPIGTLEVSPAETREYQLTARGAGGPVSSTVTVTVKKIEPELLADRGGFVCAVTADWIPPGPLVLVLLGLLAVRWLRSSRRRGP